MLSGKDQRRITQKNNNKVRLFPGATTQEMKEYLNLLFKKSPDSIILYQNYQRNRKNRREKYNMVHCQVNDIWKKVYLITKLLSQYYYENR